MKRRPQPLHMEENRVVAAGSVCQYQVPSAQSHRHIPEQGTLFNRGMGCNINITVPMPRFELFVSLVCSSNILSCSFIFFLTKQPCHYYNIFSQRYYRMGCANWFQSLEQLHHRNHQCYYSSYCLATISYCTTTSVYDWWVYSSISGKNNT